MGRLGIDFTNLATMGTHAVRGDAHPVAEDRAETAVAQPKTGRDEPGANATAPTSSCGDQRLG